MPETNAKWIAASDNEFGIELVDCTAFCRSMMSMTDDMTVATSFSQLRSDLGEEYRGQTPSSPVTFDCDLSFPYDGQHEDGPLFKAEEMEDKWDIYLYDSTLYFSRSWTGDLIFVADVAFEEDCVRVKSITANSEPKRSQGYVIGTVDYLMKSHIYRRVVPHPIPEGFSKNPDEIACWSFNAYGRFAAFASPGDTTQVRDSSPSREPDELA